MIAGSIVNGGLGAVGKAIPAPDPRVARVVGVPDGDSLRVQFVSGAQRTLRYIGVVAPLAGTCGAGFAQGVNERLAPPGTQVRVSFDGLREDGSGELQAYVFRLPGDRLLNAELLAAGGGLVLTVPPNVRHVPALLPAGAAARDAKRGVWSLCADPAGPAPAKDP